MYLKLLQVSYTVSSTIFGDTTRYPRFFRLLPITEDFADGFVAVIKELKWTRVAVVAYINEFMLKVILYSYNYCVHAIAYACVILID